MAITEEPQHLASINVEVPTPTKPPSRSTSPKSPHIIGSMFGVLNRFISKLDAAPLDDQQSSTNGAYGFQVLRNTNQEVPLEPWFDFVIGINGRTIVSISSLKIKSKDDGSGRISASSIYC